MNALRIWTDGVCTDSRGFGGWAYVRLWDGEARGVAGGERQATTPRMELTAVLRALTDLADIAAPTPITLHSDSAVLMGGAGQIGAWRTRGWIDAKGDPVAERDLWEQIAAVTLVRPVTFVRVSATPSDRHPEGFVAAWSDFAREKCKAAGAFTWAIPKPNMAKFPAA
jgi:ribonuclease HI